jgi:hypothetical protein
VQKATVVYECGCSIVFDVDFELPVAVTVCDMHAPEVAEYMRFVIGLKKVEEVFDGHK